MFKEFAPRTVYLKEYQPPPWRIETVDLVFDLREQGTRVISRLTLERNADYPGRPRELRLDGEELKPVWLRLDGSELHGEDYRIDEEGLVLVDPPDRFVLESEVEIAPECNTRLEGLYRSGGLFCTQCEAEGFRRITWYLDRPDVMARFNVRIEADRARYPVLLSNGNPLEAGELPGGRHYAVWDDPFPKPSYLFALVAGDLVHREEFFTTASGREVRLRIYVEAENLDRCDHAMRSLVKAMRWDEEHYGREYDLDVFNIVAVNDFNMGAMENKGLNIFNSKYVLARPDTATDADYQGIEAVVAHEYFHNWTGNRIT
ncbi:MAG TPA: aminopeptidase N, partial [Chromatiaceae bacterium]|nr:aminopeptidase N [Chromatiaceae bacterium]